MTPLSDEHLAQHGISRQRWDSAVRRTAQALDRHADHTLGLDDCGSCLMCVDCDHMIGGQTLVADAQARGLVKHRGDLLIAAETFHPLGPAVMERIEAASRPALRLVE